MDQKFWDFRKWVPKEGLWSSHTSSRSKRRRLVTWIPLWNSFLQRDAKHTWNTVGPLVHWLSRPTEPFCYRHCVQSPKLIQVPLGYGEIEWCVHRNNTTGTIGTDRCLRCDHPPQELKCTGWSLIPCDNRGKSSYKSELSSQDSNPRKGEGSGIPAYPCKSPLSKFGLIRPQCPFLQCMKGHSNVIQEHLDVC